MHNLRFVLFRILLPMTLIAFVLLTFYAGLSGSKMIPLVLLFILPFAIPVIHRSDLLFVFVHFAGIASLTFPGIPQGLLLRDILAFVLASLLFLKTLHRKAPIFLAFRASRLFLLVFIVTMGLHIMIHGFGIKSLGGDTWGGMNYLRILIAIYFLFFCDQIRLSKRMWKAFIVLLLVGSLIPGAAQLLFLVTDGAVYQQYMFIRSESWALIESLRASASDTGIVRYHFVSGFAYGLCMLAFCFYPLRKALPMAVLALIPAMMSGFRSSIIQVFLLATVFVSIVDKDKRLTRIIQVLFVASIIYLCMILVAGYLPLTFQRSISFLPIPTISETARIDAQGTLEWRLDIWRIMLAHLEEYILVGRGLAFSSDLFITIDPQYLISPEYAYYTHNYHSGPLGILLDFGILGVISIFMFFFLSLREALAFHAHVQDSFMHRFLVFLTASYTTQLIMFFLVFGDMPFTFPNIIYHLSIIIVLSRALTEYLGQEEANLPKISQKAAL